MNEVSCKVLDPFLRAAERRGIARADLLAGVGYSRVHLEDRHERIDYEAFEQVMANARRWFTDDDIVAIGAAGIESPLVRSFVTIGRTLMSPVGFYRWMLSSGGLGNQMFNNIVPTFREVAPGQFQVELRTAPGYRPSREFLLMARGGMEAVSRVLGLGSDAHVEMTFTDVGGRYDIRVPVGRSARARLARWLTVPMTVRNAAADLDDAMRALEARYAELDDAKRTVERQRHQLDTAYRMGHQIWRARTPERVGGAVVRGLVDVAGVRGARLAAVAGAAGAVEAEAGELGADAAAVGIDLKGAGFRGRLAVWPPAEAATPAADVASLLELLAPTVALALDNALANRELEAYQVDLERLVDARTAELTVARDDLAATVDQLRVAQASRERIFGNISHEIRTPLSLILLAIADVERRAGAELDERARADLAGVVDSARRLLRLVDELLLLAAGRETALAVVPESVDVGVLVRNLVATWVPAAEQAGLTLRCLGPTTLGAEVDAVAFERVLSNLLSNAVKFTPAGGQIAVELGGDDDRLRLSVRDTGVGIDDELLTRLFGRFERGRGAATGKSGSGIGLSLVKQLVEAHGGAIHVERLRAGGTEFRVELPRGTPGAMLTDAAPQLRPSDYGLAAATVSSGEILSPPGTVKGSILVAEDNPRLAAQVARLLAEDHVVIVALDGLAAQDLAARHRPHLLVTDVDMPGMDGIELARRFRELTGDALAPVVILSALADPGTRLAGLDAGAVDYVVKPFDPRELLARVRAQFRGRELAARLQRAEQLSALGTLSSGLAHELRNPANAIVNAVGPLRRLLPAEVIRSDTPAGQLFDVLAGCAEQIAFISRHLLGFRRGGDLELRGAAVGDVVRRAITLAQPALAGVDVREAYDPLLPVWCAPPLLVQVLVNLIGNAGQAVGAGGWVEVGAREVDDRLVIEVADSGAGVPPELRERIFEPFFTTKDPGKGTGLGLALARDIVHRHHGVLELRERGGRSVFAIDLPGRAAAEAAS